MTIENLPDYSTLEESLDGGLRVAWIIGDSGAFSYLPRIKCLKRGNNTFVLNGIGGVEGDKVLLLSNGKLVSFTL